MTDTIPSLHTCRLQQAHLPGTLVRRLPFLAVDMHCHNHSPEVEGLSADHPVRKAVAALEAEAIGAASVRVNVERYASVLPKLTLASERLADMDAMGVDVQVVSPSPLQYAYWAEQALADQLVGLQNEAVAVLCGDHPDRFVGLGTVALQDPARAARQLERLMKKDGFKGVEIGTYVAGRDIADRFFDPFWTKADELGAVVFIHPWGTTVGSRLADHYLMNVVGQPFETTVGLSKLILGGTLDRCPGVKIVAAHGGGYLPAYIGRSDHAYAVRPDAGTCACLPSTYLRRIWFDSVVYDPKQLARLIDAVGADRVVLGTDYPFDMGHYDPAGLVVGLDTETQRRLLGGNAAGMLGLRQKELTE